MAAVLENQTRRWTYEEYYRLEDDQRYEIIGGNLLPMSPGPNISHQDWLHRVLRLIDRHVEELKLGTVYFAPLDVVLNAENVVQPDLIYVAAANAGIIQFRGIFGAPDLLVEIVSPANIRRDRNEKRALYARFGVKEYWIGDPANRTLEILALQEGRYEQHAFAAEKGELTSLVLKGLEFDLAEIQ